MKISLLAIIIVAEVITIIFVGINIYYKHTASFTASISPLSKEGLVFNHESELEYFYEPKPSTLDKPNPPKWLPYVPEYTINADSLNDRFDYAVHKPNDTYRIVTLGDSFTYGLFVNTSENYTEILEDLLNTNFSCNVYKKFEVINLGYPGYDIEYSVQRFKLRGKKYKPDLVIWLLKHDDFDEISEFSLAKADEYVSELLRGEGHISVSENDKIWQMVRRDLINEFGKQRIIEYQSAALRSINDYHKDSLLVYSMESLLGSPDVDSKKIVEGKKIIEEFVKSRPYTYFYNSDITLKEINGNLSDNHPNKIGHEYIAQDIIDYLKKNDIIPC